MPEQTIVCPNCGKEIPLTETLFHQIKESLRKEYDDKAREKEQELARREKLLDKKAKQVEDSEKTIEQRIAEKLKVEREKLKEEVKKEAGEALLLERKDLQEQIAEKDKKLAEAREAELDLRKKVREAEEAKKSIELEVARRIDEEREKIKQQTLEIFSEEHRLKDLEKDKKINDMAKMIEELKRKAEQGPVQIQGEVLELDLEALLKTRFPLV